MDERRALRLQPDADARSRPAAPRSEPIRPRSMVERTRTRRADAALLLQPGEDLPERLADRQPRRGSATAWSRTRGRRPRRPRAGRRPAAPRRCSTRRTWPAQAPPARSSRSCRERCWRTPGDLGAPRGRHLVAGARPPVVVGVGDLREHVHAPRRRSPPSAGSRRRRARAPWRARAPPPRGSRCAPGRGPRRGSPSCLSLDGVRGLQHDRRVERRQVLRALAPHDLGDVLVVEVRQAQVAVDGLDGLGGPLALTSRTLALGPPAAARRRRPSPAAGRGSRPGPRR